MNRLPFLSVAAIFTLGPDAEAQERRERRDTSGALPTVSVTATRRDAAILTTPLAITKVTAAELRATSGFGLDEGLRRIPGVLAQSRYGTSDIRIEVRGFGARGAGDRSNAGTSRGVRVLVDGFPETEPDGRTAFDQIDLAASEGIEVVRSNASALWGNASGGVINLLTTPSVTSASIEAEPIYGGFGLRRFAVRSAAPIGDGIVYANFTNTGFDGWRVHSDAKRALFNGGAVGMLGDKTRLGLYASAANNFFRIPGPLTQAQIDADPKQANATYLTRDERRYNRVGRLGVTIDHAFTDATSLGGMVFVNPKYLQRSERNSFRDFTRYHVGGNLIGRHDQSFDNGMRSRLMVGVDEAYQDGAILFYSLNAAAERGTTLTDNKGEGASNLGVFVQDELTLTPRLAITVGARHDNVAYHYRSFINPALNASKIFKRTTPKLGASYRIGASQSVYANLGGGIEVPAGNEVDPLPSGGATMINPLLEPIMSTTMEVGYKSLARRVGTMPVSFATDVALYNTDVRNEMQPYNGGRYYTTAGRARRSGAEVGINAQTDVGVFGSTSLTISRNRYLEYFVDSSAFSPGAGRGTFDGNKVVGVPDFVANVALGTEVPGFSSLRANVELEHVGSYFADDANRVSVPAYRTVDLTLEMRNYVVAASGWGVRGFVSVKNVADKRYVGSAFLNPDYTPGANPQPIAFEPGLPRSVVVALTLGRLR